MDQLNIDNRAKTLVSKRFKGFLQKYHPKFVKRFKIHFKNFDRKQFFVLLYDCIPNMKKYFSIDRLLKNVNILQVGTGKNPTTLLYYDTK